MTEHHMVQVTMKVKNWCKMPLKLPLVLQIIIVITVGVSLVLISTSEKTYNFVFSKKPVFEKSIPLESSQDMKTHLLHLKKSLSKVLQNLWKHDVGVELLKMSDRLDKILEEVDESIVDKANVSDIEFEVCPEKYMGIDFDYPLFQKGWEVQSCKPKMHFSKLVSIVINLSYLGAKEGKKVAKRILEKIVADHPGVRVIMALSSEAANDSLLGSAGGSELVIERVNGSQDKPGKTWNTLVSKVNTKYTLVADNITHFYSLDARIVRLVREAKNVAFVGPSTRNSTGHWSMNCQQMTHRYHELKLKTGYDFSQNSCVFCDVITGPFVGKTEQIRSVLFDENLPSDVLFHDFFLRAQTKGSITAVCPDAMFFVDRNRNDVERRSWHRLAKKHHIAEVHLPKGDVLKFPCSEVGITCDKVKSLVVPKCCLKELSDGINYMTQILEKNNIPHEVDCGTVLGAIKMSSILPWDIDADLSYYLKTLNKTMKAFKKLNYKVKIYDKGWYFIKHLKHWSIEVFNVSGMTTDTLIKAGMAPTKVPIDGHWVIGPRNPGLYSRNKYGHEIYKHSEHWRHHNAKRSQYLYQPGFFLKCQKPSSSACLDKFFADGNIQFQET